MKQRVVVCPECAGFVDAVKGIRGSYWHGRDRAGRRKSYLVGASRDGAVTVSRPRGPHDPEEYAGFFDLLRDETCGRFLDHLADQDDPRGHGRDLPAWVAGLIEQVDFDRKVGRDAAARVAAALLGVSVRSVYRRGGA